MTRRVAFTVPGPPKGKGRPRAVPGIKEGPDGPEAYVRMVTPQQTRIDEAHVRDAFRRAHPDHRPFTGPVLLNFTAVFEIPKSFNRQLREAAERGELYAIKKPDKDNIEKLITDALNLVAFTDDQQVMGGGIKRYGTPARVDISLKSLESPDIPATPGQIRNEARKQPELDLKPRRAPVPDRNNASKVAPDLKDWSPRQRLLIERAMERDERERLAKRSKRMD